MTKETTLFEDIKEGLEEILRLQKGEDTGAYILHLNNDNKKDKNVF